MSWFSNLRLLTFARRIARALEDLADSQRTIANILQFNHDRRQERRNRKPKQIVFGKFDVEEANKRWRQQRAADTGEDEEDAPSA